MQKIIIGIVALVTSTLFAWALWIIVYNNENGLKSIQKELANDGTTVKEIEASNIKMADLLLGSIFPDGVSGDKVKTIEFSGVTLGLNVEWIGSDDTKVPKNIALLTSRQDKKTFEALKDGIVEFLGNPNNEEYEVDDDNLVYGRVEWNKGFSVTLRNIHSDEGGLIIFIM